MEDLIQVDVVELSERRVATGYQAPEKKELALTPERREKLRELYSEVVVHDFGDDYHLSEEQRASKNALYSAFKTIRVAKRKYNKLSEYVVQVRKCLDCLNQVAEVNKLIYPKDQFIKDVLSGKIEVYGLTFPKYKGKDRKEINWEYISSFILDRSKNPKELDPVETDDVIFHSEEEADEHLRDVFTDEQLREIFSDGDYPEEIKDLMDYPFDVDEDEIYDGLILERGYKDTKKLTKKAPEIIRAIYDLRRKSRMHDDVQTFVHQMQEDDFDIIDRLDRKRGITFDDKPPKFKGDILNKDDYNRYLYELSVWEEEHTRVEYEGKMKTLEEINMAEIRKGLESCGWNIRNIYGNREREKRLKAAKKRDDKKTKQLKKRLIELERRTKARGDEDFEVNTKKKKKKKKKVKGKHRKEAQKALNTIIMNASSAGGKHKSFKDYKDEMETFTWNPK